jgi:hypothetical protein
MKENNPLVTVPVLAPVKFYSNSDTCKAQIYSENKQKSGIYILTNIKNDKIYIGSSQNLNKRLREYLNVNHLKRNEYLYICRALKKHDYPSFSLTILEYCKPSKCLPTFLEILFYLLSILELIIERK